MGERRIIGRVVAVRFASIGQRAAWRARLSSDDPTFHEWNGPEHASKEDAQAELVVAARHQGGVELDPPLVIAELRAGDLCLGPLGGEVYILEDGTSPDKVVLKTPATEAEQESVRQRLRDEQARGLQQAADVAAEVAARGAGDPGVITSAAGPAATMPSDVIPLRVVTPQDRDAQFVAEVNADAVQQLEELLVRFKSGEFVEIVYVALTPDGGYLPGYTPSVDHLKRLGALREVESIWLDHSRRVNRGED